MTKSRDEKKATRPVHPGPVALFFAGNFLEGSAAAG
jgi:hypothetical protein